MEQDRKRPAVTADKMLNLPKDKTDKSSQNLTFSWLEPAPLTDEQKQRLAREWLNKQ